MGRRNRLKHGRDVTKAMRKAGCPVRRGKGSHMIGTLPDNSKIVWPANGELSKSRSAKLLKILAAAGILALLFGCYLSFYAL